MPRAHIIKDGLVVNTVEVDELNPPAGFEMAWAVGNSDIGDAWDGEAYTKPPAPEPPPRDRHITKLAFRNRYTQSEKVGIELASIDDPTATMTIRQQKAAIRVSLADTAAATFIDLERTDTRAGVMALETAGLLGAGRALQILDAEIIDSERPVS